MKEPATLKHDGKTLTRGDREPMPLRGVNWRTYYPEPDDGSLYERCVEDGRIVRTMEPDAAGEGES